MANILKTHWFWYGICFYVITGLGTLCTWLGMFSYDMFVSGYGVSSLDILWVQLVFGVWNVMNDLVGGYFSDWYNHKFGGRLELIIPFNILWCLATVIPYYELGIRPYSLHYLLYICLNDTFLSIQSIVTSAIWVDDLTKNENERIKLSLVTKPIGFIVGFTIIWFSYLFFDKDELDRFRVLYWITFAISILFTFAAYFSLKFVMKKFNLSKDKEILLLGEMEKDNFNDDGETEREKEEEEEEEEKEDNENRTTFSMKIFFCDIIRQKNLWWFIVPSVINEFQGIFLGQYRPIFVDAFLNEFSDYTRSTYIAILSNGGVVIEIIILLASFKIGCAFFVRLGIYVRLITAIIGIVVLMILYMTQFYFEWSIYLAIFMMFWLFSFNVGFIFFLNFFNLIMANLVYEQRAYRLKNKLTELTSMTSMYWAIHAMFAKPFNGVGTIIGTFVIENAGYGGPDGEANFNDLNKSTQQRVQYALFHLTAWFMFITSFIQWIFFRNYDLENEKLAKVEQIVNQHEENKKQQKKMRMRSSNNNRKNYKSIGNTNTNQRQKEEES